MQIVDDADEFKNHVNTKTDYYFSLLLHIELFNPHTEDESFMKKIQEIKRDVDRQAVEMDGLVAAKINEFDKGLSPEKIQQFLQFVADESHVGDQCQVCLEEVEVGRLMKQLSCRGRHSFCSGCIDYWLVNHNTCPICRHVFV